MDLVFIILCIVAGIGMILFLPLKGAGSFKYVPPIRRIHEADLVLSRRLLDRGTPAYEAYYNLHPEFRNPDDRSREAPGLLSPHSRHHQPGSFAAAKANFKIIDILNAPHHPFTSDGHHHRPEPGPGSPGGPSPGKARVDPEKVTGFIAQWLRQSGAHSVGFTRLEEYHLYSHKGRGPRSGQPIEKIHENAIALTVEMDHRMMQSAPEGTSVMESSEQYLRSGVLALKLAAFIQELGYEAAAHIDGNYEVICPLVAADAGLGVPGRMGLLMTPALGPRVRIAVVTTSLPLSYSTSTPDNTTIQFCHHCTKCARCCPAGAIPEGARTTVDGIERWQINSEKCYHYWTLTGTDCGRCMTVCPYSHSAGGFHRFIRWGIKNNLVFRRLAIKLEEIFYGRRPPIRPVPGWTDILDKS